MKNGVFWNVTPCGACKKRRFRGTCFHHQGDKNRWTRNNVSNDYQPTHATKKYEECMVEALSSSETSALTRATRRHIPEDAILYFPCSNLCRDPDSLDWCVSWLCSFHSGNTSRITLRYTVYTTFSIQSSLISIPSLGSSRTASWNQTKEFISSVLISPHSYSEVYRWDP
jgi:hypothetical protein